MSDRVDEAIAALRNLKIPDPSEMERMYRSMQRDLHSAHVEHEQHAKAIQAWMLRHFRRNLPKGFYVEGQNARSFYLQDHRAARKGGTEIVPVVRVVVRVPARCSSGNEDRRFSSSNTLKLDYFPEDSKDLKQWANMWIAWLKQAPKFEEALS